MRQRLLPSLPLGLLSLLLVGLPAGAAPATPPLTWDALFAPGAAGRQPGDLRWEKGGGKLAYTWDTQGDGSEKTLYRLDAASGKTETLLRYADLKGKGKDPKADFGAGPVAASPLGDSLLLVTDGDLYLYRFADRSLKALTRTEADEGEASFSPDGSRIAFVRDWNLYVLDLATGSETALTRDGKENSVLNGINDWVYEEEIWDRAPHAYWWSPDGSRIAYIRFDEAQVGVYPLVDNSPLYPTVRWQKYPKSGEPNPQVKVGVVSASGGETAWLDVLGTPEAGDPESYLTRIAWTPQGDAVALQRLNRDQTRIDLLRCDSAQGPAQGKCSTLVSEARKTWINLGNDFQFLPDGRFVWGSEREGWRRIYLYAADGKLVRPLTPQGWAITSLDALGSDGSWMVVTGYEGKGLEPIHRKVARVELGSEGWEILTPVAGSHRAVVDPRTGAWVHTWSTVDTPPQIEVRRPAGSPLALPLAAPRFDPTTLPKWEFVTVPGPDGLQLPARIMKPAGFDPSRRYPVIVYHYGGPGSQVVDNAWNLRSVWHKAMAQRGFVIFSLDNASSLFFGKDGEDRDYRRFGEVNLAGQLAGVSYLKSLPWVDSSRLGLWGWSGGGTNTLYCILNRPGVWHAAVSGAPVTDWRLYDTIWTERYLDTPQNNADGYKDSSPITYAAKLADHLLLVHGMVDDNVHTQNSINLADAFTKADRPFEEALYPQQKHGFAPAYSRHFYEKMSEFFERTLQGVEIDDVEVRTPK